MEQLEIDEYYKPSLKQKLLIVYNKHKFPLTVEPLVFLASLAFGLNEVLNERSTTISLHSCKILGDQIKLGNTEDLSKQTEL